MKQQPISLFFALVAAGLGALSQATPMNAETEKSKEAAATEKATLAGGCFWCTEAVFERLDGVKGVVSGYTGGTKENPTYKQVVSGNTGHAEAIQIEYDPKVVTFGELLEVFWLAHDPTTLNRQGADVGTQYRSAIFYHNDEQKNTATESMAKAKTMFKRRIVTEISPMTKFYLAEGYHQDFFKNNPNYPYCVAVIHPKLRKLDKVKKKD